MPINISAPSMSRGDIKVLGSGTYTTTGDSAYEDAGNFTTPGDIGQGTIHIEIWAERTAGAATTHKLAIYNAAGNNGQLVTATAASPSEQIKLRKAAGTAANCSYTYEDQAGTTSVNNNVNYFALNAAEQIFIKAFVGTAANTLKVMWIAYLIEQDVK